MVLRVSQGPGRCWGVRALPMWQGFSLLLEVGTQVGGSGWHESGRREWVAGMPARSRLCSWVRWGGRDLLTAVGTRAQSLFCLPAQPQARSPEPP